MARIRSNRGNGWSTIDVGIGLGAAASIIGGAAALRKGGIGKIGKAIAGRWGQSGGWAEKLGKANKPYPQIYAPGFGAHRYLQGRSHGLDVLESASDAAKGVEWANNFNKKSLAGRSYLEKAASHADRIPRNVARGMTWGAYGAGGLAGAGAANRIYNWGRGR